MPKSIFLLWAALPAFANAAEPLPSEWIEPLTGHRVIRLSREPRTTKLYFHQNAFTSEGDKMLVTTPQGFAVVTFATRAVEPIVEGRASQAVVAPKKREVFYTRDETIFATHLDTGATRTIVQLPREMQRGAGLTLNADESLLAGSYVVAGERPIAAPLRGSAPRERLLPGDVWKPPPRRSLEERWAARRPMGLFTVSISSGEVKTIHRSNEWLNHLQFSPADPSLLMFCHEGPWHKVDRIWTIRADGSDLRKRHARTMEMEIAGHEFFSPDGAIIWYDLQTPKGKEFWLAGHLLATDAMIKYPVAREHWSVHFSPSPDGQQFAGDGGGPRSVAAPGNGQWIYLFTRKEGALEVERLVDLSKHDYQLEPNVNFTPDGKWIVFQATIQGAPHVYAVEVAKAAQ